MGFQERIAAKKAREAARKAAHTAGAQEISGTFEASGSAGGTSAAVETVLRETAGKDTAAPAGEPPKKQEQSGEAKSAAGSLSVKDGVCRHCRICQWPACPFGR